MRPAKWLFDGILCALWAEEEKEDCVFFQGPDNENLRGTEWGSGKKRNSYPNQICDWVLLVWSWAWTQDGGVGLLGFIWGGLSFGAWRWVGVCGAGPCF